MRKLCSVFLIAFVMPFSAHAHEGEEGHNWTEVFEIVNNSGLIIRLKCLGDANWVYSGQGRHCLRCPGHGVFYAPWVGNEIFLGAFAFPNCNKPDEFKAVITCEGFVCSEGVSAATYCVSYSAGQCQ